MRLMNKTKICWIIYNVLMEPLRYDLYLITFITVPLSLFWLLLWFLLLLPLLLLLMSFLLTSRGGLKCCLTATKQNSILNVLFASNQSWVEMYSNNFLSTRIRIQLKKPKCICTRKAVIVNFKVT